MNKNYIKLFVVIITVLLSFYTFLSTRYQYSIVSGVTVLLSLVFSIPIVMNNNHNFIKHKKGKIAYLCIMYILYFISILVILLLIFEIFHNKTDIFIKIDTFKNIFTNLLFMTTSWLFLIFSFINIDKRQTKINFVLDMVVLLVIFLIHINYHVNPNLKNQINEMIIGEKALYITQNYIYFGSMYTLLLINNLIKK